VVARPVAILATLQNNGRISNKALAASIGLAPSSCLERVAKLTRDGVIEGVHARVNPDAVGRPIQAFLTVQFQSHSLPLVDPFIAHVRELPETLALHFVSGPEDFIVHVACGSVDDLKRLVLEGFTARPEVSRVQTHLLFSSWAGGPLAPFPT
jgi:DNA-binding Lrp family transcriptional regulator